MQRAAEAASASAAASGGRALAGEVQAAVSTGGRPLERGVRAEMEGAFGADFGDVRIHTGGAASGSARSLQAVAYTRGRDIVFDHGSYDPGSAGGRHLLAHELTHVLQQRSGPVAATQLAAGLAVSDPSDRFERAAEETADAVSRRTSGRPAAGGGSVTSLRGASPETLLALQRTAGNRAVAAWSSAGFAAPSAPAAGVHADGAVQRCGGIACPPGTCDHTDDPRDAFIETGMPLSIQRAAYPPAPTRLGDVPLDSATDCAEPVTSVAGERIPF